MWKILATGQIETKVKKIKLTTALGFMQSASLLAAWWVSGFLFYKNNGLVKDEAIQSGDDTGKNTDFYYSVFD